MLAVFSKACQGLLVSLMLILGIPRFLLRLHWCFRRGRDVGISFEGSWRDSLSCGWGHRRYRSGENCDRDEVEVYSLVQTKWFLSFIWVLTPATSLSFSWRKGWWSHGISLPLCTDASTSITQFLQTSLLLPKFRWTILHHGRDRAWWSWANSKVPSSCYSKGFQWAEVWTSMIICSKRWSCLTGCFWPYVPHRWSESPILFLKVSSLLSLRLRSWPLWCRISWAWGLHEWIFSGIICWWSWVLLLHWETISWSIFPSSRRLTSGRRPDASPRYRALLWDMQDMRWLEWSYPSPYRQPRCRLISCRRVQSSTLALQAGTFSTSRHSWEWAARFHSHSGIYWESWGPTCSALSPWPSIAMSPACGEHCCWAIY